MRLTVRCSIKPAGKTIKREVYIQGFLALLALFVVSGISVYVVWRFVDPAKYLELPEWQFTALFLFATIGPGLIAIGVVVRMYQITCIKCSVGKLRSFRLEENGPEHHECKFCGAKYSKYLLVEEGDA